VRPHVEFIHAPDLRWHAAELPLGTGRARQQNLSYDEENGAASTRVRFEEGWHRPEGYHDADTEWFILSGNVRLGERSLGRWHYFRAPAGLRVPAVSAAAGTEILLFREYGDERFTASSSNREAFIASGGNATDSRQGELTVVQTAEDEGWVANIYEGDAQSAMRLKIYYHDPSPPDDHARGWLTNLCRGPAGWFGPGLEHHPCFEEAYCLEGGMTYNYGRMQAGGYFFRPAYVKHGDFRFEPQSPTTFLFRLDGDLINWMTEDSRVRHDGRALNYDPEDENVRPLVAGLPLRSRSAGAWSWDGGLR
jgi:hypothetical protein